MSNRPDGDRTSIILRAATPARGDPDEESKRTTSGIRNVVNRTPPPQIEGYQILEELHRGGQGVVYRAIQQGTKRQVALKILLEGEFASETTLRRFEREVELAASLRHPNIVTILESGTFDGRYFCAMEFIDGMRLDNFVRDHKLRIGELLLRFTTICDAVNYAHQHGVIHRDLKPSNILVDSAGDPHILDFGLAKSQGSSSPHETTVALLSLTGQVVGTLAYMSPEQAAGTTEVDLRSDVYSLGVILYELLVGRTPYSVDGPLGDVLHRIAQEDPIPPRSLRVEAPYGRYLDDELSTILLRALEKDPARRYQTAGDLARDIQLYLTGRPIEAKRASGFYLFRKMLRRHGIQASFAALLLIVMIAALAIYAGLYHSENEALQKANSLQVIASQRLEQAKLAEERERESRREAERATALAQQTAAELRRALTQQRVRRGNLALDRAELADARESFWEAFTAAPDDLHAIWGLRHYYLHAGEQTAIQFAYLAHGPSSMSRNGVYTAACATADSIAVRDGGNGALLAWLSAPNDVNALQVYADGSVAAAGRNWIGIWDIAHPEHHKLLDGPPNPLAVFLLNEHRNLLAVTSDRILSISAETGAMLDAANFRSPLKPGVIECSERQSPAGVAIITGAGVELFNLDNAGHLTAAVLSRMETARSVSFSADGSLWCLGGGLFRLGPGESPPVEEILAAPVCTGWDLVAANGAGDVFLGAQDGWVRHFRNGIPEKTRRLSQGRLLQLIIDPADQQLLTLDDQGVMTRWLEDSAAALWAPLESADWLACATTAGGQVFALERSGSIVQIDAGGRATRKIAQLPLNDPPQAEPLAPGTAELEASNDGTVLSIRAQKRGWLLFVQQQKLLEVGADAPGSPILRLALAKDGRRLAELRASPDEADAQLDIFTISNDAFIPESPLPIARFGGLTIRDLAFLDDGKNLAAARSNGDLDVIRLADSTSDAPAGGAAATTSTRAVRNTLFTLSSPAKSLTIDPTRHYLAAPCEDGVLRQFALDDLSELGRVHFEQEITSVAFAPHGDVLLVCDRSGAVRILEATTLEDLALLPQNNPPAQQVAAAWIGLDQSIAVSRPDGALIWNMTEVDRQIREDRPQALQRQVARALNARNLFEAWRVSTREEAGLSDASLEAQRAVLGQALAREYWELPIGWLEQLDKSLDPLTALRFGISAFAGGRFEQAYRLLNAYRGMVDIRDSEIERRIADCRYLLDDPSAAIAAWGSLSHERRLTNPQFANLSIKQIIALSVSGQADAANEVFAALEKRMATTGIDTDLSTRAVETAREILNELTTLNPDRKSAAASAHTLELFRGELARAQGDLRHARVHYQRCAEIAGERWHAAWARFRLKQLTPQDF